MPKTLRERARAFAKRTRTSTGQLIRASLAKYLDEDEDKERQSEEKRMEIEEKRAAHAAASKRGPSSRSLGAPLRSVPVLESTLPTMKTSVERLQSLYRECARDVLAAGDDKDEVRRHVVKSVERVKKASPLRHPPESEIVLLIENEMVKLGSASSATSFASNETSEPEREYDDLVGAAIDPKRVRTRGDIIPEDADDE